MLTQIYAEIMTVVQTCEIGQGQNEVLRWRWILTYKDPCECSNIRFGGKNTDTTNQLLAGDIISEIKHHYGWNCIGKIHLIKF